MYKLCVFDLDGTLVDTIDSLLKSVNMMMERIGCPGISRSDCVSYVGDGARMLVVRALARVGVTKEEEIDAAFVIFKQIFKDYCDYKVTKYEGVDLLLSRLHKENIRTGVLSNKLHDQAVHVVRGLFGESVFRYVQGQSEEYPAKPDPGALLHIIQMSGVDKTEVVLIGDSEVDVRTAEKAGVDFCAVDWGFRSRSHLSANGAEHIFSTADELAAYLLS